MLEGLSDLEQRLAAADYFATFRWDGVEPDPEMLAGAFLDAL